MTDSQLQAVLRHNRDEEVAHATMTFEWIRRNFVKFDETLKRYRFTKGDITALEENADEVQEHSASLRRTVGEMKESKDG